MAKKGKILVIRGGAIGDFILTLPAIAALRQQFPKAHLEILGYPHIAQLAKAGGLVDRVQSIEAGPLAGFFARHSELNESLADYFSEFDIIVSYLYDPDFIFQTNVARCSPAQFILGPHRPDEKLRLHATAAFLKPLERLAIFDADPVPRLSVKTEGNPNRRIAMHPGSGSERKNWPEERWAELLDRTLRRTNLDILLIGGEAEVARIQRLAAILPPTRATVAQCLPLPQLAILLQNSSFFVGHDSGISHLAAALGLSGTLLWPDTAEHVWRPPSSKVQLLRHASGLSELTVDEVFGAVMRQANCS